ncbi:MAG: TonB-dependent receptor [Planctomycetes bacterium]|nr:TonB-dependent receptor [Planctomycetota bacterium]
MAFGLAAGLPAQEPTRLSPVVVEGRGDSLVGEAKSASEGRVGQDELARRPLQRQAEVLETIPGIIATQHSGGGNSNQLFARGFNLDHGTDLATTVNGAPINLPSHGHGQGYTDLNFLIPELIDSVRWRLGPYDVRDGDFASAGAVDIDYVRRLDRGLQKVEFGSYDRLRSLTAVGARVGDGDLVLALDLRHDDGRFEVEQDFDAVVGHASYAVGELLLTIGGYDGNWTATDQIPRRAVAGGALSRFGSLDPTDGGSSSRFGATAAWEHAVDDGELRLCGHAFASELDLWSNFTYALDDPIGGDQFEQRDARVTLGLDAVRDWRFDAGGLDVTATLGAELRHDRIRNGLHGSQGRVRTSTVRSDAIGVTAIGAFAEGSVQWNDWLRTTAGVRGDVQLFEVDSDLAANSGREADGIVSPKAGLVLGPWSETEIYVNGGTGFHSNDARGVLLRDDPSTPVAGDGSPVDPLVRSRGAEIGIRTTALPGLQSTVSMWALEVDSELLFVGDAGTSEASRASRRHGLEFANWYAVNDWLTFDADLALARSRFRDHAPEGRHIPGAIPVTLAAGVAAEFGQGWSAALRVRHFGKRPLLEDASVRSSSTTLWNARLGWQIDEQKELALDVLNLFDAEASDIEYFYESQLPGEAGPVGDVHFHPVEPFSLRLAFTVRF